MIHPFFRFSERFLEGRDSIRQATAELPSEEAWASLHQSQAELEEMKAELVAFDRFEEEEELTNRAEIC